MPTSLPLQNKLLETLLLSEYFDHGFLVPKSYACLMGVSYGTRLTIRSLGFFDSIAVFQFYYFHLCIESVQVLRVYKQDILNHFLRIHDRNPLLNLLCQSDEESAVFNALKCLFFDDDSMRFAPGAGHNETPLGQVKNTLENTKKLRIIVLFESPRVGPYALAQLRITNVQLRVLGGDGGPFELATDLHIYNFGIIHVNDLFGIFPNVSKLVVTGCYEMSYSNLCQFHLHIVQTERDLKVLYENELVYAYDIGTNPHDDKMRQLCLKTRKTRNCNMYQEVLNLLATYKFNTLLFGRLRVPKRLLPRIQVRNFRDTDWVDLHQINTFFQENESETQHGFNAFLHVSHNWSLPIPSPNKICQVGILPNRPIIEIRIMWPGGNTHILTMSYEHNNHETVFRYRDFTTGNCLVETLHPLVWNHYLTATVRATLDLPDTKPFDCGVECCATCCLGQQYTSGLDASRSTSSDDDMP